MTKVMTTGVMPDHRERATAVRLRGVSSTMTADALGTIAPASPKKGVRSDPPRAPVEDLSRPTYSPALGRNLTEMSKREQTKRDRAREEALARLREIQQRD